MGLVDFWGDIPAEWGDGWFATPGMAVLDSIRCLVIAASFAFIYLSAVAIFCVASRTQRALLTTNLFSGVLVIGVTYERLGDPATYRFLLVLGIAGFGAGGSYRYLYGPNRLPIVAHPQMSRWVRRRLERRREGRRR